MILRARITTTDYSTYEEESDLGEDVDRETVEEAMLQIARNVTEAGFYKKTALDSVVFIPGKFITKLEMFVA